jgi:sterol desaturase/sphingolipid hydroxylase (fatty acid hydroxylase superfamily)
LIGSGLWDGRKHYLDKMTLGDLVRAYAAYPAIQAYVVLAVVAAGIVVALGTDRPIGLAVAMVATVVIYPVIWYLLHRYVLHGRYLYKRAATAAVWKRIHYDHHQDPNDLGVLFGALYTTLPTITMVTLPVGWLLAGPAGAAAAFGTGMAVTCFYEYCHCIQHLAYTPKWGFLRRIKKLHLLHHFHSEKGNYGITSFAFDHVLGTFYGEAAAMARSDTVSNLGYAGPERERYPWVMNLSTGDAAGDVAGDAAGDTIDNN